MILNLQPTRTLDYEAMTTGRVARELLGLLRSRDRRRVHAGARIPYRTVTGTLLDGDPAWGVLREWLDAASRRAQPAERTHRLPRSHLSGHARHVLRLHAGARADRRARRGARDRRPRRSASSRPTPTAIERKGEEIRETFDLADAGRRPDRGRDHARDLRLVGARRGRARPPGRGLRARRADLLLPRRRRQPRRARRRRPDRRQLAAHRARRPRVRRGRPEDEHRDAPARPARRRRLLHRVLRARLRRASSS